MLLITYFTTYRVLLSTFVLSSVIVLVVCFLVADILMYLSGIGPVRVLVGKLAKFLALEALELVEVTRILLAIIDMYFAIG